MKRAYNILFIKLASLIDNFWHDFCTIVYFLKRTYYGKNQWERKNCRIKESKVTLKFATFNSAFF